MVIEDDFSSSILRTICLADLSSSARLSARFWSHLPSTSFSCWLILFLRSSKACWICLLDMLFCSVRLLMVFSISLFLISKVSTFRLNCSTYLSISAFTMGCDFRMVFTSWSLCLPWMTHSGQMHSHLQSKQKYRISSSWC